MQICSASTAAEWERDTELGIQELGGERAEKPRGKGAVTMYVEANDDTMTMMVMRARTK